MNLLRIFQTWVLRHLAVRGNVQWGRNFQVGFGSILWAPRSLFIGNDVYIGKFVTIQVDATIGDGVLFANNVGIVGRRDHDIRFKGMPIRKARWVGDFPEELSLRTVVGSDVWIGFGAIVLSGVSIGDSCIIGAGSVVLEDIPKNSIAVGNPARVIGQRFSAEDFEEHWSILKKLGYKPITEFQSEV